MAETLFSIHEAAEYAGKSVQTIRRALKSNRVEAKKRKTPQGFNYLIKKESLDQLYSLEISQQNREHRSIKQPVSEQEGGSLKNATQTSLATEYATKDDLAEQKQILNNLVTENRKDKDTFMRFVKVFQDRFTALESQVKLLEEPQTTKKWYQFWK